MITESDLQSIFSVEFVSDESPVTYRKYTSDTIPSYTLRLSNSSDEVYISVYASLPNYATLTNPITKTLITAVEGVLLPPLDSINVVVNFNPAEIDSSNITNPEIVFDLQALESSSTGPTAPTNTPTDPTNNGPRRTVSRGTIVRGLTNTTVFT